MRCKTSVVATIWSRCLDGSVYRVAGDVPWGRRWGLVVVGPVVRILSAKGRGGGSRAEVTAGVMVRGALGRRLVPFFVWARSPIHVA